MLPKLRGMFAFAIWNVCFLELFLARDPYGIEPLYYSRVVNGLLFASQVKALLATGLVSTACEHAGTAGFYLWGSVPEPWTIYRDVFSLPAGAGCACVTATLGHPFAGMTFGTIGARINVHHHPRNCRKLCAKGCLILCALT